MKNSVKRTPTVSLSPPPLFRLVLANNFNGDCFKIQTKPFESKISIENFRFTFFGYHRLRPAYA